MTPPKINIADLPEFDMAEHLGSDQKATIPAPAR